MTGRKFNRLFSYFLRILKSSIEEITTTEAHQVPQTFVKDGAKPCERKLLEPINREGSIQRRCLVEINLVL